MLFEESQVAVMIGDLRECFVGIRLACDSRARGRNPGPETDLFRSKSAAVREPVALRATGRALSVVQSLAAPFWNPNLFPARNIVVNADAFPSAAQLSTLVPLPIESLQRSGNESVQ